MKPIPSSDDRTRVYFTVDVECREERLVRGRLQPAAGYELRVFGRFANQKRELGLGFIMDELEEHGVRGTFFVDPFGARHFGQSGLTEAVGMLLGRGHDVQLHAHPIQRNPRWHSLGETPAPDDIGSYAGDEQRELLDEGLRALRDAGCPDASVRAFRAGNFGADNRTWSAMSRVGLVLDSSYNPCYLDRNCRIRTDGSAPDLFFTGVPGVWELPVTCFEEAGGRSHRHLQIAAISTGEMVHCLEAARSLGIRHVTVLTHSFEFLFLDSVAARRGRPNPWTVERMRGLLRFLDARRDAFVVETVSALADRLSRNEFIPPAVTAYPRGKAVLRAARYCEQLGKRLAAGVG